MAHESLRECVAEGTGRPIPGTRCASASVLGPITVAELPGSKVGCFESAHFYTIFEKDYFDGPNASPQYLSAAYYHKELLFMAFSGGTLIINPLPRNIIEAKRDISN